MGLSAQNAVSAQQQANIIHQAAATQGVSLIYSVDTTAEDSTIQTISQANLPANLGSLLTVPKSFGASK